MASRGGANLLRMRSEFDDKISGPLDRVRDKFDQLGKSKGAKAVLQGVGMGAGISGWNMVKDAIRGTIDTIGDSIKAASDQREAFALTEQVFGENTKAIEDWSRSTKDAFSTTEALTFASTFGTAFKSVGLALDDVTAKSQDMVKLAGDLGSAFNTSSEEAATALRSGLIGESEPMRRFGVFLSEAAVKAKAAQMGIGTLGEKLTDAQKVTARYALIMEQTADSHGMFGRDTDSLADKQKLLNTRLDDASVTLGEKFTPYVLSATEGLIGLMDAMESLPDPGAWWDDATEGVQDFIDTLPKTEYSLQKEAATAQTAAKATADAQVVKVSAVLTAANQIKAALQDTADTSDDTKTQIVRHNDRITRSYKDVASYLLGEYNSNFDKAMGIREARQDLHEAETNADRAQAYADLAEYGALSAADFAQWEATLTAMAEGTKGQVHAAFVAALADLKAFRAAAGKPINVSVNYVPGAPSYGLQPRASGGPVLPGQSYTVGEEGTETLVMGQSGGYVIPHGGGGGGSSDGGGGAPVTIQLQLDGRVVAEVVDRQLYYKAARAPQSRYAG